MKTGAELIADERKRQVEIEGYTPKHDEQNTKMQLTSAAIFYCKAAKLAQHPKKPGQVVDYVMIETEEFPEDWNSDYAKPSFDNSIKDLTKAGALICAEIDRLQGIKIPEELTNKNSTFDQWLDKFKELNKNTYGGALGDDSVIDSMREDYKINYDSGETPFTTIIEEFSNAD